MTLMTKKSGERPFPLFLCLVCPCVNCTGGSLGVAKGAIGGSTFGQAQDGIGHLSKKKTVHPSNAKIPRLADASGGFLLYNMSRAIAQSFGLSSAKVRRKER